MYQYTLVHKDLLKNLNSTNIGDIMNKYKSSFFNNCYEWLFTEEERAPIGFITTFFMIIVISIFTGLFVIPVINKFMQ